MTEYWTCCCFEIYYKLIFKLSIQKNSISSECSHQREYSSMVDQDVVRHWWPRLLQTNAHQITPIFAINVEIEKTLQIIKINKIIKMKKQISNLEFSVGANSRLPTIHRLLQIMVETGGYLNSSCLHQIISFSGVYLCWSIRVVRKITKFFFCLWTKKHMPFRSSALSFRIIDPLYPFSIGCFLGAVEVGWTWNGSTPSVSEVSILIIPSFLIKFYNF